MHRNRVLAGGYRHGLRGAALVEFAVISSVMLSLMFAIPMLGKLVDARQTSVQAGRYALWQPTVTPGDTDVALLHDRFFAKADAAVASQPIEADGHALWGQTDVEDQGLARDAWLSLNAETLWVETHRHSDDSGLATASSVGSAIQSAGDAVGSVTGRDWGIGNTALTNTRVGIAVAENPWLDEADAHPACGGYGCLTEGGAILIDGWSAAHQSEARERLQAIVPATALESIGKIVSKLDVIPILEEFGDAEGMFGHVDMRPLPAHASRGLPDYVDDE